MAVVLIVVQLSLLRTTLAQHRRGYGRRHLSRLTRLTGCDTHTSCEREAEEVMFCEDCDEQEPLHVTVNGRACESLQIVGCCLVLESASRRGGAGEVRSGFVVLSW